MRGSVLAGRVVTTSNVATLCTPSEVQPPTSRVETLDATGTARGNIWIEESCHVCTSRYGSTNDKGVMRALPHVVALERDAAPGQLEGNSWASRPRGALLASASRRASRTTGDLA